MKKVLFGVAALLLAALVLAGCATTKGSETPPSPDKLAAQLAKDLNAIKAGSATVEGATVKLSDEVQLTTRLTVPAGVTLDLTADGVKFELRDGAELTVNGTIIAGSNAVRFEDNAKAATINGSGTIRLNSKGYLLSVSGNKNVADRKLTLDGVTLVGIADNDSSLVAVGESGELVMKSGAIMGNSRSARSGEDWAGSGGVSVEKGGTFTLEGGTISGNTAKGGYVDGGGVRIAGNSTFTMTGGMISGNTAQGGVYAGGGGVCITDNNTFTMTGGTISGNTAQGDYASGGGVYIAENSTFTMTSGTISGNAVQGLYGGGGVYIDGGGTFTMESGMISGNSATGNGNGGGVDVNKSGTFTKSGGIIYGSNETRNDADDNPLKNSAPKGSAVYISSSPVKQRNTTAGEDVDMDSSKSGGEGGWE